MIGILCKGWLFKDYIGYLFISWISGNQGWFVIESLHSPGLVLDIDGGRRGGRLIIYPKHGGDNQLWQWRGMALVSKSGYALDIKDGNRAPGTNAIPWDHHGGINQQWTVQGDKIISSLNGLCLDIKNGSKAAGSEIILWQPQHGVINNQCWKLVFYFG